MIERIITWCAESKLFVILGFIFFIFYGIYSIREIPLDAIPDLSDTQVIIYVKWDKPPEIIDDQVTYPIVTALLGAPRVKTIRGISDYGFSYIYVIFEDGTDIYWARSRVLEYLSGIIQKLPKDAQVELGPDATGVGWIFEYALVSKNHSLEELRTIQDWYLKYELQSVKGVAEVASVGGFVRQYQILVNPGKLRAYRIPVPELIDAIRRSNYETGARLIEIGGREYMVTVRGYIRSIQDIKDIVLKYNDGVPVRLGDVAEVKTGPDIRRGVVDLNGEGEVVGGIVVMRLGENALNTIKRVKEKLKNLKLPEGVELVITYDRSDLILKAVNTLKKKVIEEMIVVSLIIIIFLLHIPSAMIPIITLPAATIISFIPMRYMGITANVMSLGGIAIAIGALVDSSIAMIENAHKKISLWNGRGRLQEILIEAVKEVGRPSFFSLLVIAVSFLPVFALESIEGRLFKPLAWTKNLSMFFAAILSITLVPALITLAIRKKLTHREEDHPISRFLFKIYSPFIHFVLRFPVPTILGAALIFFASLPFFFKLGSEFMPPLNEGTILYMPTTPPGISISEATRLLQIQDRILKSFPEVLTVFGKAGRADTSTDPAPLSMMETTVILKPPNEWREKKRWYSDVVPEFLKPIFRLIWPDRISWDELIDGMDRALKVIPGQVNSWTFPIRGRIDMITTGIRTPVGIKIFGDDLKKIEELGQEIESLLKDIKGTRSVYAEKTASGYFVDIKLKRDGIARYGLTVEDVADQIQTLLGGMNLTITIEGRERYPVNIRYPRELRDNIEAIRRIYITTSDGAHIPLSFIADIELKEGPGMIRTENGRYVGYVYVDVSGRDIGSYVEEAKEKIRRGLDIPPGYSIDFSGQYEYMQRIKEKLKIILPLTLFLVFILMYINTGSYFKTFVVMLSVPFSFVGVIWILYILEYNISVAVWVGIISLLGVAAETGVYMLVYLDLAYEARKKEGRLRNLNDLKEAIYEGAVKRLRPKFMAVATTFMGLLPIMWSQPHELGADTMKRIAAPMIGGIFTSFIMELLLYPPIYFLWRKREIKQNKS